MTTTTKNAEKRFETADLNQAAFLIALSHPLVYVGGHPGARRIFYFPEQAREDAQSFFQGAKIGARAFANALRDLKALVRDQ